MIDADQMGAELEGVGRHVDRANDWAKEHLRRFPHLATVTVSMGASFGLTFTVNLTFTRARGEMWEPTIEEQQYAPGNHQ